MAAVCVTTTSATTAASGARLCSVDHDRPVSPRWGAPVLTGPSTATPWAWRSSAPTSAADPTRPISAAGIRRSTRAAHDHEGQDPGADGERPPVDLVEVGEHVGHPVLVGAGRRGQPEEIGQLVGDDDDGDAGQEAGHDGGREELGDPPEAQDGDQHHHEPDHDGQDRHQVDVVRRSRQRQRGHPRGEQRRDRRVGPHRHLRVGAQEGEEHRSGDEGVETGDRWHAGQPGGRQLLGHRNDEEREAGREVRAGPGTLVALQRRQQGRAAHRDIIAHRPLRQIDPIE